MSNEKDGILKVGDMAEFQTHRYPPHPEWQTDRVEEIHILQEPDDKEGKLVRQVSWSNIRELICFVAVVGTECWGRNDDVRPVSQPANKK